MFLGGLFFLSVCKGSANEAKNDNVVDNSDIDDFVEYFISPNFENDCEYSVWNVSDEDNKIKRDFIMYEEIYFDNGISTDNNVISSWLRDIGICNLYRIRGCSFNTDTNNEGLKLVVKSLSCVHYLKCEADLQHDFFGIYIYNSSKESYKLKKVIYDSKCDSCKMIEEIHKRQLWKNIPYLFLGGLIFFAFVGLLFWLFNSDDEVYKNKRGRKKMGKINGMDNGSRARRVRKNRVKNINRGRNRINKNKNRINKNKNRINKNKNIKNNNNKK